MSRAPSASSTAGAATTEILTGCLAAGSTIRSTMQNSALGNLGKRVIAWIVIAAVAILAVKLIIGAVFGFITMILTLALIVAAIVAVMWALRHV